MKSTRDALLNRYPAAIGDPVLWRALQYFLFARRVDKNTGQLKVDEAALEMIAGVPIYGTSTRKGAFKSGQQVLEHIRDNMLSRLKWSGYSQGNYSRTIAADGVDSAIKQLVNQDLGTSISGSADRVFFDTGEKFSTAKQTKLKKAWLTEASRLAAGAPSTASAYLLGQLNDVSRPINGFTRVLNHASAMHAQINGYQSSSTSLNGQALQDYRMHLRSVMRRIEDMPLPLYQPSERGRTDRVFALNPSFLSLPSSVRLAGTKPAGWVELDLVSAHLAIGSRLWSIQSVESILQGGNSIWEAFVTQLKASQLTPVLKGALKKATYSAMYGMTEGNLKADFSKAMKQAGLKLTGKDLVRTPLMKDILKARHAAFNKIKISGAIQTPTGISFSVGSGVNEGSAWSTVMNSYELELMKPIVEYEEREVNQAKSQDRQPDFRIMLWEHDGCSVRFNERKKHHLSQMKAAVKAVTMQYSIPTWLEEKK